LLGGQTHIDIRAIERELSELWKSAAQTDGDQRSMVTRACTLNFIAVTRSLAASNAVTEAIDRLTGTHPNRAIVVNVSPDVDSSEPLLDVWVQAHCQIPAPGRSQVCCEQITIAARGDGIARVRGTILPLLVADLPVAVWYPEGEPFGDPLFDRLAELADRVIVDTEGFVDPEGGLRRLAGLVGSELLVGDLAWGRLTVWRELIAQCFDTPALISHLNRLERVRIVYGAGASRVPGLMIAGWLATRLGWRFVGRSGPTEAAELRMARPGGEVLVELRREASDKASSHIRSVDLHSPDLHITVGPGEHGNTLMTQIDSTGRPRLLRSARWQRPDTTDLLATDLRLLGRDRAYEQVLRAAASLI
jgi:glucose-6-phosphate dehydrogenase assembly protein OpcA